MLPGGAKYPMSTTSGSGLWRSASLGPGSIADVSSAWTSGTSAADVQSAIS